MSRQPQVTTTWLPELSGSGKRWAERLAEAIASDVAAGKLRPGDQLPTQRALARHLGITTGTVNRAYALAERAGVVSAEVGRGSFVTAGNDTAIHSTGLGRASAINFALNYPACGDTEQALAETLGALSRRQPLSGLLSVAPYAGLARHRQAGARWLARLGVSAHEDDVLVCTSVQHGLAASLAALTAPGDVVLTETLTSPSIKALAAMHHLRLMGVAGDDEGMLPDALESACESTGARAVYVMPTLHTPTTLTMSERRRRDIAQVLHKRQLLAIEDDAWGFMAQSAVTPLQALAPEWVVYLTSFSKCLAPGLRVGYVAACSSTSRQAITSCIGATTWSSPLNAEIASRWVDDGTAWSMAQQRIRTAREREQLARHRLGSAFASPTMPSFHLWLPLPEPWRANEFIAEADKLGVSLASTEIFVPGRAATPHAARICLGAEARADRVEAGLAVLAPLLHTGPGAYAAAHVQ
ncbi:PLP-dependent aminotransferase family protein [Dyella mobilis]|uniref:PLP-dependent aminotransferase family protein n=1 Tax=Dyella mobilis TaxID=1849582 RepID=A0ABS2KFA2_9GAMM|nr:PLP-dependent aminotransferase family protein [Dyella mobilis]MBM7129634.1 PLP-dependent aminotransferase family protein [Dyella mobilis]GLQ98100.1 transcriptional regulator [Dyella mobilis]